MSIFRRMVLTLEDNYIEMIATKDDKLAELYSKIQKKNELKI